MENEQTGSISTEGAFIRFAETAERIGATTKRLEKAALLAEYFSGLGDDDLAHAARYFAGYRFPLRDQRTTSVGGSALFSAIQAVSGMEPADMSARLVHLGDMGDLAREAFDQSPQAALKPTSTLAQIAAAFDELAATSGSKRKLALAISLLEPAIPLEAKYLVKLLAGDLRIGLLEGAVEDGIARWAGIPVGQVQWANMLLGDVGETAVRARAGTLDHARMRMFHPLKFMLATPAADLADVKRQMPPEFIVEDKFDGIRAQAHIGPLQAEGDVLLHGTAAGNHRVALFSRTLDEITESFPDLLPALAGVLPEGENGELAGLIFDGEIVAATDDRILPFQDLQQRLGRKTPTAELQAQIPVAFIAYDILYGDSRILIDEPFETRRALLNRYVATASDEAGTIRISSARRHTEVEPLDDEFTAARDRGNEGLMVKDPRSTYKPGRRGREWLKIKRALATLDVVVTAVEVGNGARRTLLSDYTFAVRASDNDPTLLNVGKAYSGLTDAELADMSEWFRAHTIQEFAHGKVRIVEPRIVIEVTFDRVQPSTRHKSGYALRFPRIVRLRPDKPVIEIDTLDVVKRLAAN
jgi:DNA ligase-1